MYNAKSNITPILAAVSLSLIITTVVKKGHMTRIIIWGRFDFDENRMAAYYMIILLSVN